MQIEKKEDGRREREKRKCADRVKGTGMRSQRGWRWDERESWTKSERGRRGGRYGLERQGRKKKTQWRQEGAKEDTETQEGKWMHEEIAKCALPHCIPSTLSENIDFPQRKTWKNIPR